MDLTDFGKGYVVGAVQMLGVVLILWWAGWI
jgi:hypothetical protein